MTLAIHSAPSSRRGVPREAALLLQSGNRRFAEGDFKGALERYHAALERDPTFLEAINNSGAALGQLNRFEEALRFFGESLEINPNDAVTLANMGLIYAILEDNEKALSFFGRSLDVEPSYQTYNNRSTVLGNLGRLEEALHDLSAAVRMAPRDLIARFNRSGILLAMGRFDEALKDLRYVERHLPDDPEVLNRKRQLFDAYLRQLANEGRVSWTGGKPKGTKTPVKLTPGPPVSDYIVEERRRLRGA